MRKKTKTNIETSNDANAASSVIKIGDLPKNTNIQNIKVKLPKHIYESSSLPMYGIKNKPVYLQGWLMGDFFVKTNLKSTQVYPMFWFQLPSDFEDFEVISY